MALLQLLAGALDMCHAKHACPILYSLVTGVKEIVINSWPACETEQSARPSRLPVCQLYCVVEFSVVMSLQNCATVICMSSIRRNLAMPMFAAIGSHQIASKTPIFGGCCSIAGDALSSVAGDSAFNFLAMTY